MKLPFRSARLAWLAAGLAAALATSACGQSLTPPAQQTQTAAQAACAAADKTWQDAVQSGDAARMQSVAQSLPQQCPVWQAAQAQVQANDVGVSRDESSAAMPAGPPPVMQTPPPPPPPAEAGAPPSDPMSTIPASHKTPM